MSFRSRESLCSDMDIAFVLDLSWLGFGIPPRRSVILSMKVCCRLMLERIEGQVDILRNWASSRDNRNGDALCVCTRLHIPGEALLELWVRADPVGNRQRSYRGRVLAAKNDRFLRMENAI